MHARPKCKWNGRGQALEFMRVKVYIVSSSNEYGINYAPGVHESKSELQEDEIVLYLPDHVLQEIMKHPERT